MKPAIILACAVALLILTPIYGENGERALDFLLLGDVSGWPNHLGDDEPAVDLTLVPCRAFGQDISDEFLFRWSRIYFPRGKSQLLEYDVLFLARPRLNFFTINQQEMMVDFIGTGGRVSIAFPLSHYGEVQEPWMNSPISDTMPIDFDRFVIAVREGLGQWGSRGKGFAELELVPGMPPVFSPFGKTEAFSGHIYEQFRPAYAKQGASVWIRAVNGPPLEPTVPAFISWEYGETQTWGFGIQPGIGRNHWQVAGEWWELMFLNLCYHTKGLETMNYDDALMKISVKSSFSDYRNSLSMFHNIVDFVSRVGANTAAAEDVILEGQELYHQAENFYLDGDYDQADARMADALMVISEAMDRATRAKDRALTWIYISEWMATMGVALFSGIVLWWLMVRRRLYREIPTTELDRSG